MTVIPTNTTRSSDSLRWLLLTESLGRRGTELLRLQEQLSSGQRLLRASDDPVAARLVLALQRSLEESGQRLENVERGQVFMQTADAALGEVVDLLREAQSVAEEEIGLPADSQTRQAAAQTVALILERILAIANQRQAGRLLFDGLVQGTAPFGRLGTAVLYSGGDGRATITTSDGQQRAVSVSGAEAFGAWAGTVAGARDLDPILAPATLLRSLNRGAGVESGAIVVSDGTTTTTVDLRSAVDVEDVIRLMEAVLPSTTAVTIDRDANALCVTSTLPGANLEIRDVPGGSTARHLGLLTPAGGGGDAFVGADLDPVLTPLVNLADIAGGSLDSASGLLIANGGHSAAVDISGCETVEDLINAINSSGCYVRARVAPAGDRLQVISLLSGTRLTIGENGGTTATDLGLRTLHAGTRLDDLNRGRGVALADGADLAVTFSDGSTASVDLAGCATIQDVLDRIEAAAPGCIQARLAAVGNGIELEDLTAGSGAFSVANVPGGSAATDLGLAREVPAPGAVLAGDDVNPVVAENAFSHLIELQEALLRGDGEAIAAAAARLAKDGIDLTAVRSSLGVQVTALKADQTWMEQQRFMDQELLALTRDLDYSVATAEFAALNALMEATLRTAAGVARLSLLDYL